MEKARETKFKTQIQNLEWFIGIQNDTFLAFLFHYSFYVSTTREYFRTIVDRPSGWTHVVLNYFGPNNGQGIRTHVDDVQAGSDSPFDVATYSPGSGRVVVGRGFTDFVHSFYGGAIMDELLFFDHVLRDQQIVDLRKWTKIETLRIFHCKIQASASAVKIKLTSYLRFWKLFSGKIHGMNFKISISKFLFQKYLVSLVLLQFALFCLSLTYFYKIYEKRLLIDYVSFHRGGEVPW